MFASVACMLQELRVDLTHLKVYMIDSADTVEVSKNNRPPFLNLPLVLNMSVLYR